MKLIYKGSYEKGKVEKYRKWSDKNKSVFQNLVIGGRVSLSISQDKIDIDQQGKGYIMIDVSDAYPTQYWDTVEKKNKPVKDVEKLVKLMKENGFEVVENAKTDSEEEDFDF